MGMGFSKDVAQLFSEMVKGFNDGVAISTQGRGPGTTTPTIFEEFVKNLANAYQN